MQSIQPLLLMKIATHKRPDILAESPAVLGLFFARFRVKFQGSSLSLAVCTSAHPLPRPLKVAYIFKAGHGQELIAACAVGNSVVLGNRALPQMVAFLLAFLVRKVGFLGFLGFPDFPGFPGFLGWLVGWFSCALPCNTFQELEPSKPGLAGREATPGAHCAGGGDPSRRVGWRSPCGPLGVFLVVWFVFVVCGFWPSLDGWLCLCGSAVWFSLGLLGGSASRKHKSPMFMRKSNRPLSVVGRYSNCLFSTSASNRGP